MTLAEVLRLAAALPIVGTVCLIFAMRSTPKPRVEPGPPYSVADCDCEECDCWLNGGPAVRARLRAELLASAPARRG